MLIPLTYAFTGLDPRTTPQIQWGNLDPQTDFGEEPLVSMAVRSLYISATYDIVNCQTVLRDVCLWIKIASTGDPCGVGGSCTDWAKVATGDLFCGTTPPIGDDQLFCCATKGTFYLQECATQNGSLSVCAPTGGGEDGKYLWMKVGENCADSDWILVAPTQGTVIFGDDDPTECDACAGEDVLCCAPLGAWYVKGEGTNAKRLFIKVRSDCENTDWCEVASSGVITGDGPPDPVTLCDQALGSHYVDTSQECPIVHLKIAANCDGMDWVNLMETCVITSADDPDPAALCGLPNGSYYRQTGTCGSLRVKVASNCDADDWIAVACDPVEAQAILAPGGAGIFVPQNVFTPVVGMTVDFDDTGSAMTGTPNELEAPCDGRYRVYGLISYDDAAPAGPYAIMISLALNGGQFGRTTAIRQNAGTLSTSVQEERPSVGLVAGDAISIQGWTDNAAGATIDAAILNIEKRGC